MNVWHSTYHQRFLFLGAIVVVFNICAIICIAIV